MSIVDDYNKLVKGLKTGEKIKAHFPTPTDKDYENGYLYRYFVQKTNDKQAPIFEINQKTYIRLSNVEEYITVALRWRIKGPTQPVYDDVGNILDFGVEESNKRVLDLNKKRMPGIIKRLTNYLQFYKK